jgi:hypothetical protein
MFAQSGCTLLKPAEASVMLGAGTTSEDVNGTCIFASKDKKNYLTVNHAMNGATPFQVVKLTAQQNGVTVKDEPALGATAYSVAQKEGHGFSIYLLKGNHAATLSIDYGIAKAPASALVGLRGLAKKVAERL